MKPEFYCPRCGSKLVVMQTGFEVRTVCVCCKIQKVKA